MGWISRGGGENFFGHVLPFFGEEEGAILLFLDGLFPLEEVFSGAKVWFLVGGRAGKWTSLVFALPMLNTTGVAEGDEPPENTSASSRVVVEVARTFLELSRDGGFNCCHDISSRFCGTDLRHPFDGLICTGKKE